MLSPRMSESLMSLDFPRSAQLASKLSAISGTTVIFSGQQDELISAVPLDEERLAAARLAVEKAPQPISHLGFDVAAGSLKAGNESLVIIQPEKSLWTLASGNAALWPLFGGLLLAIGSAFFISRAVVRPLQKIAGHLDENSPDEALAIPLQKIAGHLDENSPDEALAIPSSLVERDDEIGLLARSLVQSRDELLDEQEQRRRMQHLALLGELTTSLAHEIKNPASAILMHAQALEKYQQDATGALIKEESERIVSLVNQWLFVAKPEAPRLTSNNLAAMLRRLVEKLQALLDFHSVTLSLDVHLKSCFWIAIRNESNTSFETSLITPFKPCQKEEERSSVKLEAEEGDRILFEVTDEGKGFSETALAHFGEAFYSEREGGMGLGLALVVGVTKAHGGEVKAVNRPSGGSVVSGYFSTQAL